MENIWIDGFQYPQTKVRQDIIDQSLKVPVGDAYYGSAEPLPYRWKGDDFQVYLNKKWQDTESIDWDFE